MVGGQEGTQEDMPSCVQFGVHPRRLCHPVLVLPDALVSFSSMSSFSWTATEAVSDGGSVRTGAFWILAW